MKFRSRVNISHFVYETQLYYIIVRNNCVNNMLLCTTIIGKVHPGYNFSIFRSVQIAHLQNQYLYDINLFLKRYPINYTLFLLFENRLPVKKKVRLFRQLLLLNE